MVVERDARPSPRGRDRRVETHRRRTARVLALLGVWLGCAVLAGLLLYLGSSRAVVVAGHDAVVSPDLSGWAVLHTGPVLPDVRVPTDQVVGVDIRLGKTNATSVDDLVDRYALLASQPQGQVEKITGAVQGMALDAALRGAVVGLLPVGTWLLLGARRRGELRARVGPRQAAVGVVVLALLAVAVWQPWTGDEDPVQAGEDWESLASFLGPAVPVPDELDGIEVRGDVTTASTHRLIESAVSTYDTSKTFYADAARRAADLPLRAPRPGDTVVALVSDRHDNIGMDPVARAIADAAGATAVLDGGDDTSIGRSWEAFSLDSVDAAFDELDRWGVAGNHDHGDFVHAYLAELGWTMLDGEVVDGPAGTALLGVDDPRSSGLGSWRDETGLTFDEVAARLADAACDSRRRVTTILVHDANLGRPALDRACVDLVLGGHTHVRAGPHRVTGPDGQVGYTYTTGTTGGAAYAIALGSKPRRAADVSLVTYRAGRPAGVQWVTLQTDGTFTTGAWVALRYPG